MKDARNEKRPINKRAVVKIVIWSVVFCFLGLILLGSVTGIHTEIDVIGTEVGREENMASAVSAPAVPDEETEQEDPHDEDQKEEGKETRPPRSRWYALVSGIIWTVTLGSYFALSFTTHAWSVTWLLFIMGIAADNVAEGIFDLRR